MRSLQVLLLLLPLTAAFPCKLRHQFWDATLGSCVDCTKCNRTNQVVLRPCQVHQDTFCGPLSALDIDWSWLNPHKHHSGEAKTKHHHHRKHPSEATSDTSKEVVLSFAEDVTLHREHVAGDGDQLQAAQNDKHRTKDGIQVTSNKKHPHERPQNSSWLSTKHHKHAAAESFSEMEDHKLHWTTAEAIQLLSPHRSSNRKNHEKKHRKHDQQHVMWSSEDAESEDEAMRVIEQELMASSSSTASNSEVLETSKHSHHHHHHRKQTNSSLHKGHHNKNKHAHHHKIAVPTPESASQLQVLNLTSSSTTTPREPTELESLLSLGRVPTRGSQEDAPSLPRAEESAVSPEPFSATESLIWDGQAVILALAVFACLLFFLVAAIYSIHHARQWTRLKENFEADVEELSARLSLMTPGNGAQQADNITTTSEGSNANLQCVYLEQLLVRKQQEEAGKDRGNVYIDRDTGKKSPK